MQVETFKNQFSANRQDTINQFKALSLPSVADQVARRLDIPGCCPGHKLLIISMEETAELETAVINYFHAPISIVKTLDKEGAAASFHSDEYLNLLEEIADVDVSINIVMRTLKLDDFIGSLTARCFPCGWSGDISNELNRISEVDMHLFVTNCCLLLEQFIMECARYLRGKRTNDEFKGYISRCWQTLVGIKRVARIPNEDIRVAEDIKWIRLHNRNLRGDTL